MGLPVIGTNGGGIAEMIEEEKDGYVVDVDDFVTMAERMENLLSDVQLAEQMGAAGRANVAILNDSLRIAQAHSVLFDHIGQELG
jgi:glycosyltransferase involved in cell wall biosynthesis